MVTGVLDPLVGRRSRDTLRHRTSQRHRCCHGNNEWTTELMTRCNTSPRQCLYFGLGRSACLFVWELLATSFWKSSVTLESLDAALKPLSHEMDYICRLKLV